MSYAYSGTMGRTSSRSVAFFDLDKTIIARSSTLAFSRPFLAEGLITRRSVLRSAYAQFMFASSGADHEQMERMRAYLTSLIAGWEVDVVRQCVAETLHEIIEPLVYAEAVELIKAHHSAGRDVVIISASGAEVVEPIGAMLGVDRVVASELAVEDGRYTGEITSYAYGPHKAELMIEMAEREGYDLAQSFAYSDSETDIPMLQTVGHPFAVNPDKVLRQRAASEGWPVLNFSRPVSLTERLGLGSHTAKAAAAAGIVGSISVVALAITGLRRRTAA